MNAKIPIAGIMACIVVAGIGAYFLMRGGKKEVEGEK